MHSRPGPNINTICTAATSCMHNAFILKVPVRDIVNLEDLCGELSMITSLSSAQYNRQEVTIRSESNTCILIFFSQKCFQKFFTNYALQCSHYMIELS